MTTQPDPSFDQRIADWLEHDPNAAPNAVLETVLAALPSVPQRRWGTIPGGWRPSQMAPMHKLALGAAAVVVALAGLYALSPRESTGVGGQSPAPTATVPPTPSAVPSPAGTLTASRRFEYPFLITIPATWQVPIDHTDYFAAALVERNGDPIVGIDLTIVHDVYADPCDPEAGLSTAGQPGFPRGSGSFISWFTLLEATDPDAHLNISPGLAPVDIAGFRAIEMDDGDFRGTEACPVLALWETDAGPYPLYTSERKQFFVIDVGKDRPVIAVIVARDDNFEAVSDEALSVLETLQFR